MIPNMENEYRRTLLFFFIKKEVHAKQTKNELKAVHEDVHLRIPLLQSEHQSEKEVEEAFKMTQSLVDQQT